MSFKVRNRETVKSVRVTSRSGARVSSSGFLAALCRDSQFIAKMNAVWNKYENFYTVAVLIPLPLTLGSRWSKS